MADENVAEDAFCSVVAEGFVDEGADGFGGVALAMSVHREGMGMSTFAGLPSTSLEAPRGLRGHPRGWCRGCSCR